MAAKMAAEILDLMYLSSAFRYKDEWSVDSNEIKDVEIKHVENNNNSCIFIQDGGQDGRWKSEFNVSQLSFQI